MNRARRSPLQLLAVLVAGLALIASVLVAGVTSQSERADAASGSDFQAGNIISNENFYNGSAMSAAEIQAFLNQQGSSCTGNCLKSYRVSTSTQSATSRCSQYQGAQNESAAEILAKVSRACNISPKVLLVVLQKETSLVTLSNPADWRYDRAMGYYCPDNPNRPGWCDPEYGGFFNQVYNAAAQYQRYRLNPNDYNYRAGRTNRIAYSPSNCGYADVYIENQATAGLYIYTPYVPNRAALANMYGEGDGCSSYGNRNFFRLYSDWFGSPTAPAALAGTPDGRWDDVSAVKGGISIRGWAADTDSPNSAVTIRVTHAGGHTDVAANSWRPDVGAAFPALGNSHGFESTIEIPAGSQSVCLSAINIGAGRDKDLGCRTVSVPSAAPIGRFDVVTNGINGVRVQGWAFDTDATAPVKVRASWAGGSQLISLGVSRPDVAAGFPGVGSSQGFDAQVAMPTSATEVCLQVIGQGFGGDLNLGCKGVRVYSHDPVGRLDNVGVAPGSVHVNGWVADATVGTAATTVRFSIAGRVTTITAQGTRNDVAAGYPELGAKHGFDATLAAPAGTQQLCAVAVNVGAGADTSLGCRTVTVPDASPIGRFDEVQGLDRAVTVRGWAWDPDATSSKLTVTIDGQTAGTISTGQVRADVQRAYPGAGSSAGFLQKFPTGPGTHQVCVTATNQGEGADVSFGCQTVQVLDNNPIGRVDDFRFANGNLFLRGWAADPNAAASNLQVAITVNGQTQTLTANASRPDVNAAYPGLGTNHGFEATIPVAAGAQVCVTAKNVGAGTDTVLRCAPADGG